MDIIFADLQFFLFLQIETGDAWAYLGWLDHVLYMNNLTKQQ